jgi:hypothetical protein
MVIEGSIPFYKPLIAREEIAQLVEAVESGWRRPDPKRWNLMRLSPATWARSSR